MTRKNIKSGAESSNYQAETINIITNDTETIKNIAKNVFDENIIKAQDEAKAIIQREITIFHERVFSALSNPEVILRNLKKPSVQDTLFNAQKGYALSENKTVKDLLVELIKSRLASNENEFKDLIISEAIQLIPKLTNSQIALLTGLHLINLTLIKDFELSFMEDYLEECIRLINPNIQHGTNIQYLESLGLVQITNHSLTKYTNSILIPLFSKNRFKIGINISSVDYNSAILHSPKFKKLLKSRSIDDKTFCFEFHDMNTMHDKIIEAGLTDQEKEYFFEFIKDKTLDWEQLKLTLYNKYPDLVILDKQYHLTYLGMSRPTVVGDVMGLINFSILHPENYPPELDVFLRNC